MGIVKNSSNISEVNINNKNISEIYYGNTLVYSSVPKIAEVVFRDIDENDNLTQATGSLDGLFNNIKTIDMYGLYYAFYNCTGITGNISFPALTTVNSNGLSYAFYNCTSITSVSFPALTTVNSNGLQNAFYGCKNITSVSFPALTTVNSNGLSFAFSECTGITGNISFPALTTIDNNGLSFAFNGCTGITELHFRADVKSAVEAANGYWSKFGAFNATIYFDL